MRVDAHDGPTKTPTAGLKHSMSKEKPYHHGDLRRALLEASLTLIEREGVQGLSLRKAARQAGVSPAAPYHHFASRGALLAAIGTEGYERLHLMICEAKGRAGPSAQEQLAGTAEAYVTFAHEHAAHFRVMFRPELHEPDETFDAASDPLFDELMRSVVQAQSQKSIPPGDARHYALLLWSSAHGLASLLLDGPLRRRAAKIGVNIDTIAAMTADTLLSSLRLAAEHSD